LGAHHSPSSLADRSLLDASDAFEPRPGTCARATLVRRAALALAMWAGHAGTRKSTAMLSRAAGIADR